MRPGDVITHFGGRTSEVNNTDAEGRLVLADAMAYAVSELAPSVLLDIATLTGAMKVALGQWTAGLFANDDALAAPGRGRRRGSGEPLLADAAGRGLRGAGEPRRSPTATTPPAAPGAITAALFLQHFAGDVPWAHIDFASAAESPTDRHEWTAGPSGFGPRLLLDLARLRRPAGRDRLMLGLTVRWSLTDAPEGVEEQLRDYVAETSHARFTGMAGLRFKTWRMVRASGSRAATSSPPTRRVRSSSASSPRVPPSRRARQIVGSAPVLIEACDVVAVAEGWDGFGPTAAAPERLRPRAPTPSWRPAGRRRRAAAPAPAPRARGSCDRGRGW